MDVRLGPQLRNILLNVANHRQTNLAVTALLAFVASYIALAALLDRSLLHPLTANANNQLVNFSGAINASFSPPANLAGFMPMAPFALFLLWAASLALGRFLRLLFLPALAGPLAVGLLLANVPAFRTLLPPPEAPLAALFFEFAFLLVLLRVGLGIDQVALRRQLPLCAGLGIFSPLVECLALVLLAHFLFQMPLSMAVLLGFALAPSSPAVIVPAMLSLRANERGTESGVPTAVLCSSALDNVFLLTAFSISLEVLSANSEELSYTLTRIPAELLVGAIFGLVAGVLLRSFPRPDVHWAHFLRGFSLIAVGTAFHFGTRSIGCGLAGPVAVLLMAGTAAMHWQMDNHKRTRMEENGLKLIWDLLASPLLFLLIGSLLDFSTLDSAQLGPSIALLLLGLVVRLIASVGCAFCSFGPSTQERLFLGFSLLPKATVQIAMAPAMLAFSHDQLGGEGAALAAHVLLLTPLICAPLGELAIRLLGPVLLRQKLLPSASAAPMFVVPTGGGVIAKDRVTYSDPKDNRLRLELGPTDPVDPPNTMSPQFNRLSGNGSKL